MIISQIQGGLGNQMFQYAIGRHLSCLHQTKLILDLSFYSKKRYREFLLDNFRTKIFKVYKTKKERNRGLLFNKIKSFIQSNNLMEIDERKFKNGQFDLTIANHCYLKGYWQSQDNFIESSELIKKDFRLKRSQKIKNSRWFKKIINQNSVSIHVRRGDYLSDLVTNSFHGIIGIDFYKAAIKLISEKIEKPVFFIFSDDIEWCQKNFKLIDELYFIDEKWEDFYDLKLMSLCSHNIIANSTFSWWAAWLNSNSSKTIICPKKWFNNDSENNITNNLIPQNWISM